MNFSVKIETLLLISYFIGGQLQASEKPFCIPRKALITDVSDADCKYGSLKGSIGSLPFIWCKEPPDYKGPKTPEWDPVKRGPKDPETPKDPPKSDNGTDPKVPDPKSPEPPKREPPRDEPPQEEPPQEEPPQEPPHNDPPENDPPENTPSDGGGTEQPNPDDFECANPMAECTQEPDNEKIKRPSRGNAKDCSSPDVTCSPDEMQGGLINKPSPFDGMPKLDCSDPRVTCSEVDLDGEKIPFCEEEDLGGKSSGLREGGGDGKMAVTCIKNPGSPECKNVPPPSEEICKRSPWLPGCMSKPTPAEDSKKKACEKNPWLPTCAEKPEGEEKIPSDSCENTPWLPSCRKPKAFSNICSESPWLPNCSVAGNKPKPAASRCAINPWAPECLAAGGAGFTVGLKPGLAGSRIPTIPKTSLGPFRPSSN